MAITGTLGVLLDAKGYISAIMPYLEKIKTTDFRVGERLTKEIRLLAGET